MEAPARFEAAARSARREPPVAPGAELVAAARILAQDLPHLVREELALLRFEARSAAIRAAIASVLGVAAALGVLFLAAGAALAVSQALEAAWAGPLIVGGALAGGGGLGILLVAPRRRASAPPPSSATPAPVG